MKPAHGFFFSLTLLASVALAEEAREPRYRTQELKKLSLEELTSLEVSTLSRKAEPLSAAAAAVYVVTREDILRAGVLSLPEALRLVPGVEVARLSSHSWSISIRGFNSSATNKLLVLIDGRSVYTPLFAGVFWDVQDTLIDDIERIEVIAGPGGALWGANAVNGIVNVITRDSAASLGTVVEIGSGTEERAFGSVRHGFAIGPRANARVYAKYFERDASRFGDGDGWDRWDMAQGGFRIDRAPGGRDRLTVQGDVYVGERGDRAVLAALATPPPRIVRTTRLGHSDLGGGNVLGRWTRQLQNDNDLEVQAYWDRTTRRLLGSIEEERGTFDLDLQHRLRAALHDTVWGVGYRSSGDEIVNSPSIAFIPAQRRDDLFSAFLQHQRRSSGGRFSLVLGSKFEHNDYTGFEFQPTVRTSFAPDDRATLWAAASRAVRTPSRLDADLVLTAPIDAPTVPLPVLVQIRGTDDFDSEQVLAYEMGFRRRLGESFAVDVALFYNAYSRLQSTEAETPIPRPTDPVPNILLPSRLDNGLAGSALGTTFSGTWSIDPRWRLQLSYAYLELNLHSIATSLDASTAAATEGRNPPHQAALHSYVDLPRSFSVYAGLRYVDRLRTQNVPSRIDVDLSLLWRPSNGLELSVIGRNLLDSRRIEFGGGGGLELERSLSCRARWHF